MYLSFFHRVFLVVPFASCAAPSRVDTDTSTLSLQHLRGTASPRFSRLRVLFNHWPLATGSCLAQRYMYVWLQTYQAIYYRLCTVLRIWFLHIKCICNIVCTKVWVDLKHQVVYFEANVSSPLEKHLWVTVVVMQVPAHACYSVNICLTLLE